MSLIHEALKKAQLQKQSQQSSDGATASSRDTTSDGPTNPQVFAEVKSSLFKAAPSKRTIVLLGVFAVLFLFFLYNTFFSSSNKPQIALKQAGQKSVQTEKVLDETARQEVAKLKDQAVDAFKKSDFDTAWASLNAASSIDEKDAEVWNNLGVVLRKRGETEKAEKAFKKALDLRPNYPESLNNIAILDIHKQDYDTATTHLQKALELKPNYAEALFHLALVSDLNKKTDDALAYYKQVIALGKNFPPYILDQVRDRILNIGG
ncbi:MAG: hypothetical protein COX62_02285 [Deltaproteobacteria bacterium CG_4_10_14_0_2_um_filter_43_8]|nr:MAG: hypothetical protein COV43_00160 [Deltaproteobacteria bacterium CG11_big_fil_rev_8_21_14_0_20_42_23]PJA21523.1 MAG: hypothetical protein COX62_02285 [Deltaproteobacteria bacterium CG_4_10_14_0_2_um_filter_43_8]PJC64269.1 MAG: hypothetical protein CO021_04500 [Deltaproteobacteria bacterium CG_4_9_14_0_2_um_filter_42_21]